MQYVQQEKTMQEINMKNNMENQSINSPVFVYAKDSLLSVKRIALICPRAKAKCLFNCRRRNLMVARQATTGLMLHARGVKISVGSSPCFLSLLKSKLKTNLHN